MRDITVTNETRAKFLMGTYRWGATARILFFNIKNAIRVENKTARIPASTPVIRVTAWRKSTSAIRLFSAVIAAVTMNTAIIAATTTLRILSKQSLPTTRGLPNCRG